MIEEGIYTGYVWMSDSDRPLVLENEKYSNDLAADVNPFILEAQLLDVDHNISISVKYVDGRFIVNKMDLGSLKGLDYDEKTFVGRHMGRNLVFRTYWRPVPDPLCLGMDVLKAAETAFVGFEKR